MKKICLPLAALAALLLYAIINPGPSAVVPVIPQADFPDPQPAPRVTAPTPPAELLNRAVSSKSDTSAKPAATPAPDNVTAMRPPLFPDAETLAVREIPLPDNRVQRIRLLQTRSQRSPVRVEEIRNSESSRTISRHAMLADQILIQADEISLPALRSVAEKHGYTPRDGEWNAGRIVLKLNKSDLDAVPDAIAKITDALGESILIEPDHLYFPTLSPNDPQLWNQWGIDKIEAREAWDFTTGSPTAVVAVIDSGAMLSHPDLAPNLIANQKDFFDGDNVPDDSHGHGTHVAGIVGAVGNNSIGVVGTNWQVGILPLRVGDGSFSTAVIADALDYVVDLKRNHGVNIVATNNSYGSTKTSDILRTAIERTRDAGILFIAAAGNDTLNMDVTPSYPASYTTENIISVASTTSSDLLSSFSNYSSSYVHLAAPGSQILSTTFNGSYGTKSGTSMAAPFVAGAVALLASAAPEMTWREIKETLLATVDPLPALQGKTITGGRLNLHRAIREAAIGTPKIEIASPTVSSIRLADTGMSLHLNAAVAGHPALPLTWEKALGENEVAFSPNPDGGTFAAFAAPGDYILRAKALVNGIEILSEPIFVHVGPADILTPRLSGHWKMDDASGTLADDSSSHGADGNLLGNATWTSGKIGGAIDFDGTNSRVEFHAASSPQVTISAWVRSDSAGLSIFPRIVDGPEHLLFFGRDESGTDAANRGTIKFLASKTEIEGVWYSSPNSIGDGEWLHVAVTYDGNSVSNVPAIYLNGNSLPVSAQLLPVGSRAAVGTAWSIGNDAVNTRPWDGSIDELRIYDRILSPAEIQALAQEPSSVTIPASLFNLPSSIAQNEPATFGANFPADWSTSASSSWTVLSGPASVTFSAANESSTTATFSETGIYTLLYQTEKDGIRLGKTLLADVGPALPPLAIDLTVDRTETIRHPGFPVAIRVTANRPVSTPTQVSLQFTGDAQSGTDFQSLPSTIDIPAGETSAQIDLIPLANSTTAIATLRVRLSPSNPHSVSSQTDEIRFVPYLFSHWQTYFSPQYETTALATPSGDGFPNLLKYALGLPLGETIPRDHPNLPRSAIDHESGAQHLTLTFRRPATVRDIDYVPESFDFSSGQWQAFNGITETIPIADGFEQVTIYDPVPLSDTNTRLIRLKIRLPE